MMAHHKTTVPLFYPILILGLWEAAARGSRVDLIRRVPDPIFKATAMEEDFPVALVRR